MRSRCRSTSRNSSTNSFEPSLSRNGTRFRWLGTNSRGSDSPSNIGDAMKLSTWAVTAALTVCATESFADVKLPTIFSDNMVLQRSEKAPFFGTADKGEKVTVKVGAASAEATADDAGKWKLFLDTRNVQGGAF